jgi:hypothetical protein
MHPQIPSLHEPRQARARQVRSQASMSQVSASTSVAVSPEDGQPEHEALSTTPTIARGAINPWLPKMVDWTLNFYCLVAT